MAEEQEDFSDLPEDHPVLKALRAERASRKAAEHKAKFIEIASKHPSVGLTMEDFEGRTPDKWESYAERLAALAGRPSQTVTPQAPETPNPEAPARPETAAFERMQQPLEGSPPLLNEQLVTDVQEAWRLQKRDPATFERLRQAGRIQVPGMEREDRGGSIIFNNKS
jgi:hypothetical protein